jgi:hypothetical protein
LSILAIYTISLNALSLETKNPNIQSQDQCILAFAGKRLLPDDHSYVSAAIASFFPYVLACYNPSEITMLNGLAEGSDQIAAEQFLGFDTKAKKHLHAILPMAVAEFKKTIELPAAAPLFEKLWEIADQHIELKAPTDAPDENAPFRMQSNYLVENGDMLLASADLAAEVKVGGTLDTIQKFLNMGKPVFVYEYTERAWYISGSTGIASTLNDLIKLEDLTYWDMKKTDIEYFKEISEINANNIPDRYLERPRFKILSWFENRVKQGVNSNYQEYKLPLDHHANNIEQIKKKYDSVAYHYSKLYRGGYLLNYFGFAIAVTIAAFALCLLYYGQFLKEDYQWIIAIFVTVLGMLKLAVIITIIRNTENLKRKNINRKHVDFRYVAERLRVDVAYAINGQKNHFSPKLGSHLSSLIATNTATKLYEKIVLTELASIPIHDSNNHEAREYLIQDQLNFHIDRGHRHRQIEQKLEHWSEKMNIWVKRLVILDLLLAALYLICHFCNWHYEIVHYIHHSAGALILITISLPAFVACLVGITAQSEYDKLAIRNERLENELELSNNALTAQFTQNEFDKAAQKMVDEVAEWTLIYEKKVYEM